MPAQEKFVAFPRPEIEPELREFIDTVLVPILVRDALRELSSENHLASARAIDGKFPRIMDQP